MVNSMGVIGAGAWGTALALQLTRTGHPVTLWAHEPETVEAINRTHTNPFFLPGIELPPDLQATSALEKLVASHTHLIWATPSQVVRPLAQQVAPHMRLEHQVALVSKGLEADSLKWLTQVLQEEWPQQPGLAVLSGPTFALELAQQLPTAAVLAGEASGTLDAFQQALSGNRFRLYRSPDLIGVQVGGAVKNVLAIAAGIVDGMALGLNARAALVCRGLAEMTRLGLAVGGRAETFSGLSGLGDLVLTATGSLSRNHEFGRQLGAGQSVAGSLPAGGKVVEGAANASTLLKLAQQYQVELPICEAVHQVVHQGLPCADALQHLLERDVPTWE